MNKIGDKAFVWNKDPPEHEQCLRPDRARRNVESGRASCICGDDCGGTKTEPNDDMLWCVPVLNTKCGIPFPSFLFLTFLRSTVISHDRLLFFAVPFLFV